MPKPWREIPMKRKVTVANITPGRVAVGRAVKKKAPAVVPDDAPEQPDRVLPQVEIKTPITPKAVREQILSAINAFPEGKRAALVRHRLKPLDRLLSSEEAEALERYASDEENFEKANISRYDPDQVDTSATNRAHIEGVRHEALARHTAVMVQLSTASRQRLHVWCQQMNAPHEALSDYAAAVKFKLIEAKPGIDEVKFNESLKRADRVHPWHIQISSLGRLLISLYALVEKQRKARR